MINDKVNTHTIFEEIKKSNVGESVLILPDIFLTRTPKNNGFFGNAYTVRHYNKKDLVLIDMVQPEVKDVLSKYVENGYTIKGLLLTNESVLDLAYADLSVISRDMGGAPIFMHPFDAKNQSGSIVDITAQNNLYDHFSISTYVFPDKEGTTVAIYSEINNGMLFAGNAAIGSSYTFKEHTIARPSGISDNKDIGLAQNWKRFTKPMGHLLPRYGKPLLYLTEGQQKDVIIKLGKRS